MRKMLTSAAVALTLLAGIAGFSGAERLDRSVEAVRVQWTTVQALPPGELKRAGISALRHETARLLAQHPGNRAVQRWHHRIARTQQALWRQARRNAEYTS